MNNDIFNKLELIMKKLDDINYGYVDHNKNIYPDNDENWDNDFASIYILQSPEDLLSTKYGVCFDQVELERYLLLKEKIIFNSYFIVNYDGKIYPTHTFIIVNENDKYYWIEHSWEKYRGIKEYISLDSALIDIKSKFEEMIKKNYHINNKNTIIYQYDKPKYGINCEEFYKHCESGKKININN